jgi:hypothetical protein
MSFPFASSTSLADSMSSTKPLLDSRRPSSVQKFYSAIKPVFKSSDNAVATGSAPGDKSRKPTSGDKRLVAAFGLSTPKKVALDHTADRLRAEDEVVTPK